MAKNEMRPVVAEWLTALGINPRDVPIDSDLFITEADGTRTLHYEAFVVDADGQRMPDERGTHVLTEPRTIPVTADPPEHWQPFQKPTREQLTEMLDGAYRERAHLVAHLASVYPSHIGYTDPSAPDWAVVIVQTPTGQMSWHVAPRDMDLFEHVPHTRPGLSSWDGHTTDQKYQRLRALTLRAKR